MAQQRRIEETSRIQLPRGNMTASNAVDVFIPRCRCRASHHGDHTCSRCNHRGTSYLSTRRQSYLMFRPEISGSPIHGLNCSTVSGLAREPLLVSSAFFSGRRHMCPQVGQTPGLEQSCHWNVKT